MLPSREWPDRTASLLGCGGMGRQVPARDQWVETQTPKPGGYLGQKHTLDVREERAVWSPDFKVQVEARRGVDAHDALCAATEGLRVWGGVRRVQNAGRGARWNVGMGGEGQGKKREGGGRGEGGGGKRGFGGKWERRGKEGERGGERKRE